MIRFLCGAAFGAFSAAYLIALWLDQPKRSLVIEEEGPVYLRAEVEENLFEPTTVRYGSDGDIQWTYTTGPIEPTVNL